MGPARAGRPGQAHLPPPRHHHPLARRRRPLAHQRPPPRHPRPDRRRASPSTSAPPASPTPSTTPTASTSTSPSSSSKARLDALTVAQACGETVAAVATGSTAGARRDEWIDRLRQAPCVLVAFDHDENGAGDKAAAWWLTTLPNARRWLPLTHDVNSSPQPLDVQRWVDQGLAYTGIKH